MTSTQTLNAEEHPGLWFYDLIMAGLEPDLCSTNIDMLDELYANETTIDHNARMARYEKAFAMFDAQVASMQELKAEDMHEAKKNMKQKLHSKETKQRSEDVTEAEQMLENFDDE